MAVVTKLDFGYPQSLVQNQVYALPSKESNIYSTANLDVANDVAFTTNSTITALTSTVCSAAFVRCTAATNCIITLKAD